MTTLRLVSWIVVVPISAATIVILILIGAALMHCDCRTSTSCDSYLPVTCDPKPAKETQWPT
jgi:hypothetical protein